MMNMMRVGGYNAVVSYDPETEMFYGEFVGLNGGADFYAADVKSLKQEAETSLRVFLQVCEEQGIAPVKRYSGKFNVRLDPQLHGSLVAHAKASGHSLNALVSDTLGRIVRLADLASGNLEEVAELMEEQLAQRGQPQQTRPRKGAQR